MQQVQKLLTGLLLLFLVGGLLSLAFSNASFTGAVTTSTTGQPGDYIRGDGLFCYRSYFCQSGIECMYLDEKKPFCTQPAAFDRNLGQKHGDPCFINQNGQVECPFIQYEPKRAAAFEEGKKTLIKTSRGYFG